MFKDDIERLAEAMAKKCALVERSVGSYLISSGLAGAYLGFGIGLILSLGGPLAAGDSPMTKLVMGVTFGIALTLVIFAGAELFTGNNMLGVIGALSGHVSWGSVLVLWFWCYLGNLLGSLFLAWLLAQSGLFGSVVHLAFINKVVSSKMNAPLGELFVRGILANWLVCLAVWMAARTRSESAKLVLIFWCLLGFIAPGFEHSIANMSSLALGLLLPHGDSVSWWGYVRNLSIVTLGNIVGGGFFVGGLYWLVSPVRIAQAEEAAAGPLARPVVAEAQ
jgi:nitrite transporter NirC